MREKILWFTVILFGLMLAFAQAQQPSASQTQIGRYQVVTAPGNSGEEVQAFKIDTATGKTWVKAISTSRAVGWMVVPELSRKPTTLR